MIINKQNIIALISISLYMTFSAKILTESFIILNWKSVIGAFLNKKWQHTHKDVFEKKSEIKKRIVNISMIIFLVNIIHSDVIAELVLRYHSICQFASYKIVFMLFIVLRVIKSCLANEYIMVYFLVIKNNSIVIMVMKYNQ